LEIQGLGATFAIRVRQQTVHQRTHGFCLRRPPSPNVPRLESQRKQKINDEITAPELRVLDAKGQLIGILQRRDALKTAQEQELDLVEIAPQAKPPVAKIIDYGKFSYEQQKREKQQKKAQVHQTLKEMRFKAGTDTHDFDFKTRHAREFLEEGHKVRATVMFRGREIVHIEIGQKMLQRFIDSLVDVSKVDQPMKQEGRLLAVTLAPDPTKALKKKKEEKLAAKAQARLEGSSTEDVDEADEQDESAEQNETTSSPSSDTEPSV
jgi:translation initiation factor IF-3